MAVLEWMLRRLLYAVYETREEITKNGENLKFICQDVQISSKIISIFFSDSKTNYFASK